MFNSLRVGARGYPWGWWNRFLHGMLAWLLRRRVNSYYLNARSLKIKHRAWDEKHHDPRSDLTFPPLLIVLLGGLLANFAYFACFLTNFGSRSFLSHFFWTNFCYFCGRTTKINLLRRHLEWSRPRQRAFKKCRFTASILRSSCPCSDPRAGQELWGLMIV